MSVAVGEGKPVRAGGHVPALDGIRGIAILMVVRNPYTSAPYGLLPFRLDALAVGALLALAMREPDGAHRLSRWVPRVAGVAAIVTGVVVAMVLATHEPTQNGPLVTIIALPVIDWTCAGVILAAALGRWRVLELGLLRTIGRYSYGMYVYHFFVEWPLAQHVLGLRQGTIAHATFSVFGTFAIAALSYHLLEEPFLRLKDRIGTQRSEVVPQAYLA